MPLSPEEFYANAVSHADDEGRLPLSRMTGWEIFPFEPDGLKVVPLAPPVMPEAPRSGEDPDNCYSCRNEAKPLWESDNWLIALLTDTGAPLVLSVRSKDHYDLPNLPDELAAELGVLLVHVARAIEALPNIARAHVSRWGDGGAHLHLFVFARPEGFPQLRGTCMAIWDDLLPPANQDAQHQDAETFAHLLVASFGGQLG